MINKIKNALIIAPHPDDESLSSGGTILKLIKNKINVSCLVVSGHLPPLYTTKQFEITKLESIKAFEKYKIKNHKFLEIPATQVKDVDTAVLNKLIHDYIFKVKADLILIPFPDRHIDHRIIFDSSLVASRPNTKFYPKIILAYETLSETHWNAPSIEPNFCPNYFINIDKYINKKLKILSIYKSQISKNNSRSLDAIKALAKFRGSQNGCNFAEAFQLIRYLD